MSLTNAAQAASGEREEAYALEEQIGFILRQVSQRHAAIFAAYVGPELTPTQWAVLAKLNEAGPLSQNLLGRMTAMDVATVKGVIDRLQRRGHVSVSPDAAHSRRLLIALTSQGRAVVQSLMGRAKAVTEATLAPLDGAERRHLQALLSRLR